MTFLIIEIGKWLTNYFHGTKVFGKALQDAVKAKQLNPEWPKVKFLSIISDIS